MSKSPPIVAVGLLTQPKLDQLGQDFDRAFPIDGERVFEELLRAIDEADCKLRPSEDASAYD